MDLHSAKGLEFASSSSPEWKRGSSHNQSLGEPDELEEERRLCYVGVTPSRERLYLTHSWSRLLFGSIQQSFPSRFLKEIPEDLVEDVGEGVVIGSGRALVSGRSWGDYRGGGTGFKTAAVGGERPRSPVAKPVPASSGAELLDLVPGEAVLHARFGEGVVIEVEGEGDDARATIRFPNHGEKRFLIALSPLRD